MLDHILQCVLAFERQHGSAPDVAYTNPFHHDGLRGYHPNLFNMGDSLSPGLRLVIVPGNQPTHAEAAAPS